MQDGEPAIVDITLQWCKYRTNLQLIKWLRLNLNGVNMGLLGPLAIWGPWWASVVHLSIPEGSDDLSVSDEGHNSVRGPAASVVWATQIYKMFLFTFSQVRFPSRCGLTLVLSHQLILGVGKSIQLLQRMRPQHDDVLKVASVRRCGKHV